VGAAEERANLLAAFGGTIRSLGTRRANLVFASPSRARSMSLQVFTAAILSSMSYRGTDAAAHAQPGPAPNKHNKHRDGESSEG
jgi:hypothetical protein